MKHEHKHHFDEADAPGEREECHPHGNSENMWSIEDMRATTTTTNGSKQKICDRLNYVVNREERRQTTLLAHEHMNTNDEPVASQEHAQAVFTVREGEHFDKLAFVGLVQVMWHDLRRSFSVGAGGCWQFRCSHDKECSRCNPELWERGTRVRSGGGGLASRTCAGKINSHTDGLFDLEQ